MSASVIAERAHEVLKFRGWTRGGMLDRRNVAEFAVNHKDVVWMFNDRHVYSQEEALGVLESAKRHWQKIESGENLDGYFALG